MFELCEEVIVGMFMNNFWMFFIYCFESNWVLIENVWKWYEGLMFFEG